MNRVNIYWKRLSLCLEQGLLKCQAGQKRLRLWSQPLTVRLERYWKPQLTRLKNWLQPRLERLRLWLRPQQERLRLWWQPRQEKILARFRSLTQREQGIVLGGGLATVLLVLYAFVWSPLNDHLDYLRLRIQAEKKNAAWARSVDTQLRALKEQNNALSVNQLSRRINAVQEDLQQAPFGHNLTQLTQTAPDEIHAVFDKVSFDELIAWLMTFSQQHHLIIQQGEVRRLNNVGLVQASFILQVGKSR